VGEGADTPAGFLHGLKAIPIPMLGQIHTTPPVQQAYSRNRKLHSGQNGPVLRSVPAFLRMKNPLLRLALTLLLVLPATGVLRAQQKPAHKEPETELGKGMETFNGAWRKLRKQVADPASNASSLELVATVKAGLEKTLPLTPIRAQDVPAADRAKYIESYRTKMKEFLGLVGQLEAALKAGDNPAADALVQKMGSTQREDHQEFRRPDE